jgi:hypothetical protein
LRPGKEMTMGKTIHAVANWSSVYTACDEQIQIDVNRYLYTTRHPEKVTCEECKEVIERPGKENTNG